MLENMRYSGELQLIKKYCHECECKLIQEEGFGYSIIDKKSRRRIVTDRNLIIYEANELRKIHKLEDSLKEERDFRKRRKIRAKLANIGK